MKHIIVTFTPYNAVIRKTNDLSKEALTPNVVVDPSLGHLVGVMPQYWKIGKNGRIEEMTPAEKAIRDIMVEQNSLNNKQLQPIRRTPAQIIIKRQITEFGMGFIIGALITGTLWLM